MSKSKGNVVDPSDLIDQYGADTVRLFSLFAAPPERDLEWNAQGVDGASRFLKKVFRLVHANLDCFTDSSPVQVETLSDEDRGLRRKTHQTIKRVTSSIETNFHFNTAISGVMELVNQIGTTVAEKKYTHNEVLRESLQTVLILLSPIAPHFCEELWQVTGHDQPIDLQSWPAFDPIAAKEDELTIVVQVNGKVRTRLQVSAEVTDDELKKKALADDRVIKFMDGKEPKKIIVVKRKLVNIVN